VATALEAAMPAGRIDSPARIAAFLAQIGHESGGLTRLVENLNYSAQGLAATWPNRYAGPNALALKLARKPEAIANNCYANRMGNGDEASGDGWRYRGRGLVQVTGRNNYEAAGKALGQPLLEQPELLQLPGPAARSAVWFWKSNGCNELADADKFEAITRKINGGMHGQAERVALRNRIIEALRP
jgi:putative chitinase